MIEMFNARTEWVASEVLDSSHKNRAKVLKFFIEVADHCRKIHNFNTLFEIIAGLRRPEVQRLSITWCRVESYYVEKYGALKELCDQGDNYNAYRAAYRACEGYQRLPPILVVVKDLFQADEQGKDDPKLKDGGKMVNFKKYRQVYSLVDNFMRCKDHPYCLTRQRGIDKAKPSSSSSSRVAVGRNRNSKQREVQLAHDSSLQV
jgi:son of sevenless-like protein